MKKKDILFLVMAIISTIAFTFNLTNKNIIINIDEPFKVGTFLTFVIAIAFFEFYKLAYKNKEKHFILTLLAIIFAFIFLIGYSFHTVGNSSLIFGNIYVFLYSIFAYLGYFFFFNALVNYAYLKITNLKLNNKLPNNKIIKFIFEKHPFISTFIILFICYLPYLIAFYPGILSPDPSFQVEQFFGIKTKYSNYTLLLDENVTITNHHPVLHTVFLGSLVKLGHNLGSDNLGIFFYTIIQTIALISLLSYIICYFKKLDTPFIYRLVTLLIFAFVPVFPFYALSPVKDVYFAIFVILYIIQLYELIKDANKDIYSVKRIVLLIGLMLLITLFRNNGIYLILMSFPFLLIIDKKNRLKILVTLMCPILLYFSFTNILLPALKISPGSIREVLSIPFQQTARYVKYYGNEVTDEEERIIDKVLIYDTLAKRYNPEKADAVKNKFNKYATKQDLINYFKVWFHEFLKHPGIYVEATIHNTYGYFYPDHHNWYIYYNYDENLKKAKIFDYHYNNLEGMRNILSDYGNAYPYIPVLGLIVNIGFCTMLCMYLFTHLIARKKYRYLIYFTPVISLVLVCIASPVNTYFRYTLGYVFAIPIIGAIFLNIINEGGKNNE